MFNISIETIGDIAIVLCEGRIVRSEAAYRLRDAIMSQRSARVVVVDLSEVQAIEGGGLGMLGYLQRWAHNLDIQLKVFNPSSTVQDKLDRVSMPPLDIATTDEMIALLDRTESRDVAVG